MVSHQQHRSQRRSINHQLRVDTHTRTSGTPLQSAILSTINQQAASIIVGSVATMLDASGGLSPLLQAPSSVPLTTDIPTITISPVLDLDDQSSVHISMVSSDAVPRSPSHSQYRGNPISLFPAAQDEVSLSGSVVLPSEHSQVPLVEVTVTQVDPFAQLLQGFQSMFSKQEQDCITDRVECHRFEATVQGLITAPPHHCSGSVVSQS
jgi:hypothetical protein